MSQNLTDYVIIPSLASRMLRNFTNCTTLLPFDFRHVTELHGLCNDGCQVPRSGQTRVASQQTDGTQTKLGYDRYMPSSFTDLIFTGERIEVGLRKGKFDYVASTNAGNRRTGTGGDKKKDGDAHAITITPTWPSSQQTPHNPMYQYRLSSLSDTHPTENAH